MKAIEYIKGIFKKKTKISKRQFPISDKEKKYLESRRWVSCLFGGYYIHNANYFRKHNLPNQPKDTCHK